MFCVFAFEFVVVVSYDDSDVVLDAVNVVVVYVDDTAVAAAAAVSLVVVVFVVVNVHLLFVVYAVVNFYKYKSNCIFHRFVMNKQKQQFPRSIKAEET